MNIQNNVLTASFSPSGSKEFVIDFTPPSGEEYYIDYVHVWSDGNGTNVENFDFYAGIATSHISYSPSDAQNGNFFTTDDGTVNVTDSDTLGSSIDVGLYASEDESLYVASTTGSSTSATYHIVANIRRVD